MPREGRAIPRPVVTLLRGRDSGSWGLAGYVLLAALFGFIGYTFIKLEMEPAPLLLGFVLGPMMEENLRRSMLMGRGDPSLFLTRPISLGFLIATVLILIVMALPAINKRRGEIAG